MKYEKIKTNYKYFLEHLSHCHYYINELTPSINKYLQNYCKHKNKYYNEDFANKLEISLLYFEKFLIHLDEIFEYSENINLPNIKNYRIKKYKKWKIIKYEYCIEDDADIFIDKNSRVDWENIKKNITRHLHLCKSNENIK